MVTKITTTEGDRIFKYAITGNATMIYCFVGAADKFGNIQHKRFSICVRLSEGQFRNRGEELDRRLLFIEREARKAMREHYGNYTEVTNRIKAIVNPLL